MTDKVQCQIRLPTGKKVQGDFGSDQTLEDVENFVCKNSDLEKGSFSLLTAYPRKEYTSDVFKRTKLAPFGKRFVLTVLKASQKGKFEQGKGADIGKVLHADNEGEFKRLLGMYPTSLFVVDFFATWCPPCRRMTPILEKLAQNNRSVVFVKIDVDKALKFKASSGITAMPTLHFWKSGARISNLEIKGMGRDFEQKMEGIIKEHGN